MPSQLAYVVRLGGEGNDGEEDWEVPGYSNTFKIKVVM